MSSTEKFPMEKTVPVDPHACVKKLEMDPDTLGLSSAQEELDALMLEQAMLEELVEQQKLELELSHTMEKMALIENPDPVEEARSYINRKIVLCFWFLLLGRNGIENLQFFAIASARLGTWMVDNVNMDNLETLPYDPGMAHEMVEVDKDPTCFNKVHIF